MQQGITLANVDPDLCDHMASLADKELTQLKHKRNSHVIYVKMSFLRNIAVLFRCVTFQWTHNAILTQW